MTVLDTLTLALGIDSKGIDVGLADAQRKIDQGARSLANSLLSPFKAALGSLIAGFSLAAITRQYLQQADAIGKLSDSIGADMEDLQAWGEAAKRAGGSAEAFQGTVQSLTRNLQQAATNAKGPAAQALLNLASRPRTQQEKRVTALKSCVTSPGSWKAWTNRKPWLSVKKSGLTVEPSCSCSPVAPPLMTLLPEKKN